MEKIGSPWVIYIGFIVGTFLGKIAGVNITQIFLFGFIFAILFWLGFLGIEKKDYSFSLEHSKKLETDPIDEIEELFDKIKESGIIISKFEEQSEIITSNLIMAYYLAKLERKLK